MGPCEGRQTGGDAGSETAPRLPPPEACDGDRERRDRDKRPESGEAGKPAKRIAQFASVAPGGVSPGSAAMGVAVAAGPAEVGSAARAIPAGSVTTTASSPSTDSHRPARVDRIARLDEWKELGCITIEDDQAGGRPIVYPDAAGFEVSDEAADADLLAHGIGETGKVDVTPPWERVARGGGRRRSVGTGVAAVRAMAVRGSGGRGGSA